jgi:hypothetical protein
MGIKKLINTCATSFDVLYSFQRTQVVSIFGAVHVDISCRGGVMGKAKNGGRKIFTVASQGGEE